MLGDYQLNISENKRMAVKPSISDPEAGTHAVSVVGDEGGPGVTVPLLRPYGHEIQYRKQRQESPQAGATFVRTCFNGLNALSGVGIVSIPYALSSGGWLSLVVLFVLAAICCYTGLLLQRCMQRSPNIKTYPDIGEFAFGHKGRVAVSVFMYLELYLVSIGFLILQGDNLENLFPGASIRIGMLNIAAKQLFVILVALVVLPTTWMRSMGLLAYVSAGGVLVSVIMVCSVLSAATVEVGFHERGRLVNLSGLPTALGLYAFCYCGHAVFPTLCTSMKDSTKFSKVLIVCFVLCTINYGSMAIIGYLMYGDNLKSQVTLNLPIGNISSKIAIYTTVVNPLTKYALMVTPIANAIEERLAEYHKSLKPCLTRTLLMLSMVTVALAIPFFGYLIAFIGSLLGVVVSILLPCLCYLKIFKPHCIHVVELVTIFCILMMGCVMAVTGTYTSLREIYHKL
ncbi:unnamed protein product [Musa acuminata subsp. burmannicoides]